jgi:hypothetical protein
VRQLALRALPGPPARWRVLIQPLPVSISGVAFTRDAIRPGDVVAANYELSSDADVTVTVVGPDGSETRRLATQVPTELGARSIRFDGFNPAGRPLADGTYKLVVGATDATGATATGEAQLLIDGHGPIVRLLTPPRLSPSRAIVLRVTDVHARLRSTRLWINDRRVAHTNAGAIFYRPPQGWPPGQHRIRVVSHDRLGNKTVFERTITVRSSRTR